MILLFSFLIAISYLIGGIPTGLIVLKKIKNIDPRNYGSGNIGAVNVMRVAGIKIGLVVFFLDALKGFLPSIIAVNFFKEYPLFLLVPFSVITGNIFSPFIKFKGGKGVATSFGTIIAIAPFVALISLLIYIFILTLKKISSLASLTAGFSMPIFFFIFGLKIPYIIFAISVFIFLIFTHRENIKRILKNEEMKIM